jgi:hypothetical protein
MKSIKWILAAALAACGDYEASEPIVYTWPVDEPSPYPVEVDGELYWEGEPVVEYIGDHMESWFYSDLDVTDGHSDEPDEVQKTTYTIPNGYGIAGSGVGCNTAGFAGGFCKIPKGKTWCVFSGTDTEPPTNAMRTAADRARAKFETFAEGGSRGWNITVGSSGTCTPHDIRTIKIKWANLPPGIMGRMVPFIKASDEVSTPAGTVKPWTFSEIELDPSNILTMPGYSSRTPAQQDQFATNLEKHELFHSAGLAHNGIVDTLMASSPVMPPAISSLYLGDVSPTGSEGTMLKDYKVTN